ncbi:MAG: SDR family oxidoreductase [Chloroflexi bacterium]|nr:SDR family oxidoreductase [Chloroflexota bacterium]
MPLPNPFDFSGKTVVLTGATGGLGKPVTLAFGEAGANVVLGDVNDPVAEAIISDIQGKGISARYLHTDVRVQGEVKALMELAVTTFGQIDVLVNCAGIIVRRASLEYDLEVWERIVDINLKGTWIACQEAARYMLPRGYGKIVNFASNAAFHGIPGYPAYGPSKAGVANLTKNLAVEWARNGLNVNGVAPGFTDTPFNTDVIGNQEALNKVLLRAPLGKLLPEDSLVGTTLFLASDAAKWVNGHTLNVDGGYDAT